MKLKEPVYSSKFCVLYCAISILLFNVTLFDAYGQKNDGCDIKVINKYSIKSEVLSKTIDSLTETITNCTTIAYFGEKLMVILIIENDTSCQLIITPECCTQLFEATSFADISTLGVLNDAIRHTFIIGNDMSLVEKFCSLSLTKQKIKLQNSSNLYKQLSLFVNFYLTIKNGGVIVEEFSTSSCDMSFYVYQVKKGDTWRKLNKKFNCDFSIYQQNLPALIESVYLKFHFYFDNGKIIDVKF